MVNAGNPVERGTPQPTPEQLAKLQEEAALPVTRGDLQQAFGQYDQLIQQRQMARPVQAPPPRMEHVSPPVAVAEDTHPIETPAPKVAPVITEKPKISSEKSGSKPVEVNAGLSEWINNGVGNFLFGIDRQRRPLFMGLTSGGGTLALSLMAKGLALSSLVTPAGLPLLGISALAGLTAAGISYLLEKRYKAFKTTMPTPEGDKKVNVSFVEWINNALGNFFLGKNRQRAPIAAGLAGMAAGGLAGLFTAPILGPGAPLVATAVGTGVGGALSATSSFIADVRRPAFRNTIF